MNSTRRGLLDGAARAFAENGLRRSTMQSVAAAAGVAKATLYNHFRTKDEVARELLAAELDRLAGVAAVLPTADALAALADELGAHPVLRRLAHTDPEVLGALLGAPDEQWARLTERLAGALGLDPDGADLAARWLVGVVLHPGRSTARHRQAARLASAVAPPAGAQRERVSTIRSSPGPA